MPPIDCAALRELAPDLVLGDLPGDERARIVGHLATCPACETFVADLALAADGLLLLAPEVEPPAGFEERVLRRFSTRAAKSPRRWTVLASLAAALLLVAGAAGGLIFGAGGRDHYPPGITGMQAGALVGPSGERWGEVLLAEGATPSVVVEMSWDVPDGAYSVEIDRSSGPGITLDGLVLHHGAGILADRLPSAGSITQVRVVDLHGHTMCVARLSRA